MLLTSLRRVLVASGLVAVTSFMASNAAFAAPAQPNTKSATIILSGTVASTLNISLSNQKSLPLANLAADFGVATLTYGTNAPGLTVTVSGTTATPLQLLGDGSNNPPPIPFQLAVGTGNTGGTYVGAGGILIDSTTSVVPNATPQLFIKALGAVPTLFPGTYTATVTLTATDR